ncbi:60S ribosome subunit biogenesis protein NIP7 [Pelomyxa schiedti]|nr:60S ribosome subunit biogenesis protein NIP7 [Pelomyxa schiedti]
MRPLTEEETRVFFEKLANFIGRNIKLLLEREDAKYCFRLHESRVYYLREDIEHHAVSVPRDLLLSVGVCFGKFTKHGKFKLLITCLDYLSQYAKHKLWIKPSAEMSFLYGNHILKAGLGRITENTEQNQGVVIFSMADVPLGFGVMAQSTQQCRKVTPEAVICYHNADVGEYLREEETSLVGNA